MISLAELSQKLWGSRFASVGLGLVLALAHVPFSIFPLMFVAIPIVGQMFLYCPKPRQAFGMGWFVGFGYFALNLHWIVEPFLVEPEIFGWLAPFALFLMAAGAALFWAVPFGLAKRFGRDHVSQIILLACLWTVSEYLRSFIFTGFPWSLLAYVWIDTPLAQIFAFVGVHGAGLITLLILFIPVMMTRKMLAAAFATALIGIIAILGWLRMPDHAPNHASDTIVRMVQPNAEQHMKWRPDMIEVFFDRGVSYTSARTSRRPDVVIWPETSLPFLLGHDHQALQVVADAAGDASVIAGIRRVDDNGGYNSLVYLDPRGGVTAVYDKHHLVPFGEYLPFDALFSKIGLSAIADNIGGFSAGTGPRVINGNNVPDFLPLICYEAIFPYSTHTNTRPEWMVHITNDAWFGTFSGPYQHLAQTKARAIETGLPIARAANTGVSGMIDPYGRMVKSLELGQSGYVDVALPASIGKTVYAYVGEWLWLCFAGLLALCCLLPATRTQSSAR
ncbi:apolipoprotein N-acyltransferase [Amylibacter kogurei]|uniref:Apolipoprotein N-acyltransferase n=1 Tax=Paramylibacter kogurei TaxID=1889778 RepID=A0A2G5K5I7_9RHOB|nr:apolipoprotein N-acyltransferase [Amylibacter kogurei]PIB23974.1 apolipoprotein N-acyltransferase [Amylibacter kogurei]